MQCNYSRETLGQVNAPWHTEINYSGMARRTGQRAWRVDLSSRLPRSQSDRTFVRHPRTSPNHGCQIVAQSWLWPIMASPVVSGSNKDIGGRSSHWCTTVLGAGQFGSSQRVELFVKFLGLLAERIVLLGGHGCQGAPVPPRGVLGLQRRLSGWFVSGSIHMTARTHCSLQLSVVSLFCLILPYVTLLS